MTPALETPFSTVLLEAETGTGKSLLSLKATENLAFEPAEAFHCTSTITGTQGCLVAPELGEVLSPLHPSVNGALKAIWLFVAPGISPQVESKVSDEDSIGEKNKWHMMGGGGCRGMQRWLFGNYLLSQSRGRKRHLEVSCSLQMHEEYFACHSILSSYKNEVTSFSAGAHMEMGCFPRDYTRFQYSSNHHKVDSILYCSHFKLCSLYVHI